VSRGENRDDTEVGVDIADALDVLTLQSSELILPRNDYALRKEPLVKVNKRVFGAKSISQSSSGVFSNPQPPIRFGKIKDQVRKKVHNKLNWELFQTLPKVEKKPEVKRRPFKRPGHDFKSALCRFRGHRFPTFDCEENFSRIKNAQVLLAFKAKLNIEPCQQFFSVQVFVTKSSLLALEGGIDLQCDILVSDIRIVEIDPEFRLCFIKLRDRTITLSHSDHLQDFLGALEFSKRRIGPNFKDFILPISWNGSEHGRSSFNMLEFVEIHERDCSNFNAKDACLMYREVDDILDDGMDQPWRFGHFSLKLNALYLLAEEGSSAMPEKFWILNERNVQVCAIQDGNRPHMIQLKLPWEHLELSLSSTEELQDWLQVVQAAIQYQISDMNNANTIKTTYNDVALVLSIYGLSLYHCFGGTITKAHQVDLPSVVDILRTNQFLRVAFETAKHRERFIQEWKGLSRLQ
ncbi:hypothetical protein TCAL_16017, partial [Tigriopus californicus]